MVFICHIVAARNLKLVAINRKTDYTIILSIFVSYILNGPKGHSKLNGLFPYFHHQEIHF